MSLVGPKDAVLMSGKKRCLMGDLSSRNSSAKGMGFLDLRLPVRGERFLGGGNLKISSSTLTSSWRAEGFSSCK